MWVVIARDPIYETLYAWGPFSEIDEAHALCKAKEGWFASGEWRLWPEVVQLNEVDIP